MDERNIPVGDMPDMKPEVEMPDVPEMPEAAVPAEGYNDGILADTLDTSDSIIPDPIASPDSYDSSFGTPDPVASPDSYSSSFGTPDPVASPDSYSSSFGTPDPVASPDSYSSSFGTPDPVAPSASYGGFGNPEPSPMPQSFIPSSPAPQASPQEEDPSQYTGHYSWNGSSYQDNNPTPPPQSNAASYQQPVYSQNANGSMSLDPDLEKRANTVQLLGILSIVFNFVCCSCVAPILSIIGLVKASGMNTVLHMMSEESKKKVDIGKKCCWAGIIISIIGFVFSFIFPILIGLLESY